VDRVLSQAGLPKVERADRPAMIDPYLPFIMETLKQYPTLTASRLYAMVRERGYGGGPITFAIRWPAIVPDHSLRPSNA